MPQRAMSYRVLVDDNFHYMEEDERYIFGEFHSLDAAIAACKKIVDDFLVANYKSGMTAEDLYDIYTSFGDDPFIRGADTQNAFSAWDYAKTRCEHLCQRPPNET
jgi:hypothetical protein